MNGTTSSIDGIIKFLIEGQWSKDVGNVVISLLKNMLCFINKIKYALVVESFP